jgi:hypothetical protein
VRRQPVALSAILEDEWDAQLFRGKNAVAIQLGWTSYHTLRSKGSKAGYPDRTLVRAGDRIIFAELKREQASPTPDQIEWLDRLAAAGGEVYLWRPSDLDEIARVLATRWRFGQGSDGPVLWKDGTVGESWQPASLWIPGTGRADIHHNEQQSLLTKGAA